MAEEFESVVEVFRKFGEDTVADIQKSIDSKKINASKVMRQSLDYHVVSAPEITHFTLDFGKATYAKYVDEGRGPTKQGGNGALWKSLAGPNGWIAHKGIAPPMTVVYKKRTKKGVELVRKTFKDINEANENLAKMIARKIHRKGTKATHFYSEVVTPQIFDELKINLAKAAKKDISLQIRKQ
jgi:hypothetical protein